MPFPSVNFERSGTLLHGKRLDSAGRRDRAKRLGAVDGVSMREDENSDWETSLSEGGRMQARDTDLVCLTERLQHLEVELQNMKEATKDAIKKELKAELLVELPHLGNSWLAGNEGLNQSSTRASSQKLEENVPPVDGRNRNSDLIPEPKMRFTRERTLSRHVVEEYEFQESVWDLALFIGLPELGLLGSTCSAMLLLANVVLQVGMIVIINEVFTEHTIVEDTITSMRHWRVFFGHSFELANKMTFESLSSSVCRMEEGVPYSEGVLLQLREISEYMPSLEYYNSKQLPFGHLVPHFETVGMMLCIFAILIWLLEIVAQCDKQWHLAVALKCLPTYSRDASECLSFDHEGSATLTSMSAYRKAWSVVLIILQFLVILPLAAMGVCFMIATTHMRDLLLNCSALAIVHTTDEMFYAALAPRSGKALMRALKPLPRRSSTTYRGLNCEVVFFTACILSTIAYAFVPLTDLLQILRDTRQEICGGNRNFIASLDNAGIINAGAVGSVMDAETLENTYAFEATRQLIFDEAAVAKFFATPGSMSGTVSGMTSSIWSLQTQKERNVVDVMEYWNAGCRDMLPTTVHRYSPYLLHILKDAAQHSSIDDCNDVRTSCSGDDVLGTRTRQICPVTCGCTNRSSSLALEGIIGCPPSCAQSPDYNTSMWSKACVDEGLSSVYWSRFISGLRSFEASYPANSDWVADFNASIQTLQDHGCNVIPGKLPLSFVGASWANPCITSPAKVKSLIFACPISCECHTKYRSGCPLSCRSAATGDLE